tara:strand:+ start:2325 stop:2699 length:375 start_codon:yes stop_codon:yes gene_type:complete
MENVENIIISYDIDGTVIAGDPPGIITMNMIKRSKELGYIIGSASDRTITDQTQIWERNNIEMDFIVLKHTLPELVNKLQPRQGFHIGDTNMDEYYAKQAGLTFIDIINGDFEAFWESILSKSF